MIVKQSHFDVVGLGQCSLDILGQVAHYPDLDQKEELSSLLVQGGGPVATALVTLARLGVPTSFIGAVGDDDFGDKIRQGLLSEKVDCTYLETNCNTSSQVAFITVDNLGHRNIFWHRGTASPVVPTATESVLKAGSRILHLDGLHLSIAIDAAPDSIQWGGPTTEMTMKKMFVLLVVVAVALIVAKQVGHEH